MSHSVFDAYDEFSDVLSPVALHQFLAIQAWTLHTQRAFVETWVHAERPDAPASVVHLPRDRTSVDFKRRMAEAAYDVARVFDWSLAELAEQVATAHADIFYVRVASSASDGTIPLSQASATIDAIERMVKSAAIITNNPHASGKGRTSERVSEFLSDDVRMGHTRRGSFIITVAARLQESRSTPETVALTFATPDREPTAQSVLPEQATAIEEGQLDFTRRVMTTLSRGLDATSRHLRAENDFVDLDTAESAGVTIPMIEALEEIGSRAGAAGLDLTFEWSPVVRQPDEVPTRIAFDREQVGRLPRVIERMKRRDEPAAPVDVVGPVVALSREEIGEEESGEVQILADIDGYPRKVLVDLEGRDYDWAIYAHRHRLPFSVNGSLDKVKNRWRLVGKVRLDTTYLSHFQAERMERLTADAPREIEGPPGD